MPTFINEATRQELISQGKKGKATKTYKTNRYERRKYVSINPSSKTYNQIDMNALFKGGLLSFKIPVKGETDNYEVELLFDHFIEELQKETKQEDKKCEYKTIAKALMRAYNRDDTYIACSCPDWQYRFAYWSTKDKYNGGKPELRPIRKNVFHVGGLESANYYHDQGSGCKHVMLVLSNLKWAMKVSTVINNYIKYMEKNMPKQYADIIFPAVYGVPYKKAVQLGLFDLENDELANTMDNKKDTEVINKANADRDTKFRKGGVGKVNNQQPAFKKKDKNNVQQQLDLDSLEKEGER